MEKKDAKESARKSFNLFKKKPSVSDVADTNGKDPLSPRSKKSAEVLESPRSRKGIFRRLASHDTVSRKERKEAEKDLKRSCSSTSASEELSSSAEAESVEAVEEVEPVVLEPVEECDNIWGESDKAQNIRLISPTSHMHDVRCATLNKLVERLTTFSVVGDGFDQLQRIFFMTFRSFASPTDILERMIARYEGPPPDSGIELSEDELRDIRKVLPVLPPCPLVSSLIRASRPSLIPISLRLRCVCSRTRVTQRRRFACTSSSGSRITSGTFRATISSSAGSRNGCRALRRLRRKRPRKSRWCLTSPVS
jgi:hypothetical protein